MHVFSYFKRYILMSNGIKVLIADDEPDLLELLVEVFEDNGFNVFSADCGNDAAKILGEEDIKVVLSDFRMPNGDGLYLLEECYKLDEDKRPYFFFISAYSDLPIEECLAKGVKKFFEKPCDLEKLVEDIEKIIDSGSNRLDECNSKT